MRTENVAALFRYAGEPFTIVFVFDWPVDVEKKAN